MSHAIERGDCRCYLSFDTDERWASKIDLARRMDDPAGVELRRLQSRYAELREQEQVEGAGLALVLDHPFNMMLSRKGILRPRRAEAA